MNLREYAVPYDWQGVRLWYLSYRPLTVDTVIRGLEALRPHYEYVHEKTGERTTVKPPALIEAERKAESKAAVAGRVIPVKSDWRAVDLWGGHENAFAGALPLIVDAEFPERLTAEQRAFQHLWGMRHAPLAERWEAFALLLGTDTSNALWSGYLATRDTSFASVEGADASAEIPLVENAPPSTVSSSKE